MEIKQCQEKNLQIINTQLENKKGLECTHFRKSEEKEIKHKIYNRKETIKTMEINRMYTNRKINETKSHFFEKND